MTAAVSIADAVEDQALFGQHFRDRESFAPWFAFNRALFGLPLNDNELGLYRECTRRDQAPSERATEAFLVVGRRGGKSRDLALVAAYLAAFVDWQPYLAPGERAYVVVIGADRRQCRAIMGYLRAFLLETPTLSHLFDPKASRDTADELELTNGLTVEVATCSFRTIRGRTIVAALCDEAAFWAAEDGSNPASEVIASLRPAMSTIPGAMLLVASSPYQKRGPLYDAYKRYFGKDGPILVWQAPSRTMNPSLPQSVVDEAFERDPTSAAAEYGAQFRSDVAGYVSRDVIDGLVIEGRRELLPVQGVPYVAFIDPSGGSSDSMTLALSHAQDGVVVVDCVREWRPPFSPDSVCAEAATLMKSYGIGRVRGDRYAGEWPRERLGVHGVEYITSDKTKSELYLALLPLLNSGTVELLDLPRLIGQLASLERRTARGGRDSVDHTPGGHDDIANAVAGAVVFARTLVHQEPEIVMPIIFSMNNSSPFNTRNARLS